MRPEVPDYELLRVIGRGSYGDVWLARSVVGIYRAVKVVWRDRFGDAGPYEREFRGLAEFAAVSLAEIVQMALLHVGRNEAAGFFYYVMELADDAAGGSVIHPDTYTPLTLRELSSRRGRVPADECLAIGIELARALGSLHGLGLVHRDVKPTNVIFVRGVAKLADIGLVARTTEARTYIGTKGYVPPEGPGSPRADVYALGTVLFELAMGRPWDEFPRLPDDLDALPDHRLLMRLNAVILRACDPDAARRYPDAGKFLAGLNELRESRPARARRVLLAIAAAVVLAAGAAVVLRVYPRFADVFGPHDVEAPLPAISIAVLPFENLTGDTANDARTDSLHDDVLSSLRLIPDLRVLPRTSVMRFRHPDKPLSVLGRELGVTHFVEGTFRQTAENVVVSARLIEAGTERVTWSETYKRGLATLSTIQTELANDIGAALARAARPAPGVLIERRQTDEIEAHENFLKGRRLADGPDLNAILSAEPLLNAATKLDPKFTAAWCTLVLVHSQAIYSWVDTSPERKAKAAAALRHAVRLAPEAPEVIQAKGIYHLYTERDWQGAKTEFQRLRRLLPNDGSVLHWLSLISWSEGRVAESLSQQRRAVALDPANQRYSSTYQNQLRGLRRWAELVEEQKRLAALLPGCLRAESPAGSRVFPAGLGDQVLIARTQSMLEDSDAPLAAVVARCTAEERETLPILYARMLLAESNGDLEQYRRLEPLLRTNDLDENCVLATRYFVLGDREAGLQRLREMLVEAERQSQRRPTNANAWLTLARIEAMLGNKAVAQKALRRSLQLNSERKDPISGTLYSRSVAVTYAWMGETELAISELTGLVGDPRARLSGREMRTIATFWPLRGNPQFDALANDPRNDRPLF